MSLQQNLISMEHARERYWLKHSRTSELKLRWRAITVRHCFHVLPGESILEIGAGSGLWTKHLADVVRGESPITAAVFSPEFVGTGSDRKLPNTNFVCVTDLFSDFPPDSFDYIVGTSILCHDEYSMHLRALYRLLKPGGQILFFEANFWNPQVFIKTSIPSVGRWAGNAMCQVGLRKYLLLRLASHQDFTQVDIIPYDILHPSTPRCLIGFLQSITFLFEHTPIIREFCGTLYIWAKKPGIEEDRRPRANLAVHPVLFGAVSFVVPCHNEEMNIPRLVEKLIQTYDRYIHEIIIVNDNSTDGTSEVTRKIVMTQPRVKLLDRNPPNGVGLALRDGYAAATGRYIFTMDSDFVQIVPEFRDLFDAIADGYDGAIGSRFSHESMLINYPFFKILCNRAFHLLVKLFLLRKVRDVSNNLKLYRAEILKGIDMEEPHFAANAETGLKPLLAGYNIKEVPISWINRTLDMGSSSFRIERVAPRYFFLLIRTMWRAYRGKQGFAKRAAGAQHMS
jgi:dolichol-phosphate mannosyltransferase